MSPVTEMPAGESQSTYIREACHRIVTREKTLFAKLIPLRESPTPSFPWGNTPPPSPAFRTLRPQTGSS